MADVSGAGDSGQSIGREASTRVGLGLLSRFIGAVFLVLLGGLLLLDRALQRANVNQAALDSQSAALLTEAFVANHAMLLERVAEAVDAPAKDSTVQRQRLVRLLSTVAGGREIWVTDAAGRRILEVTAAQLRPAVSPPLDSVLHLRARAGSLVVVARGPAPSWIALLRGLTRADGSAGTVGLLVSGDSLEALLQRTRPDTRRSLVVLTGTDTVVRLGRAEREPGLNDRSPVVVRLPNGGTWRVLATHALTSRSLRWGLWALGVLGVLFLALGLLREQQRAIQVADRSVELERLYSDVKRANQAKSEFLANVSHELRTPLNAIVGFVELLRDGFYGDLSPRQVPPVDRIAASATHLRHLVDQVLDIAKIAAGRLEVHAETIVLRPFVLNVASELESLVSEKGLAFSITVGASLPRVRTDPTHLRQILINLIGNAVK